MRVNESDRGVIVALTAEVVGADAMVRLFGSRVHDDLRGGDIDLLVSIPHAVERPALLTAQLAARLERALGGRKVDVVLHAPNLRQDSVHRVALAEGVLLSCLPSLAAAR
jgi:predicted nucleotidyltransferase